MPPQVDHYQANTPSRAIAITLLCSLTTLMLFQGGFFPEEACWISAVLGSILCALVLARTISLHRSQASERKNQGVSTLGRPNDWARAFVPGAFCIVSLLYGASSVVHGLSWESYLDAIPWLFAAIAALACSCLNAAQRRWLISAIGWLGVASSWVGVAIASNLLPIGGAFHADRLQFTFQYANAAGAWFACSALLCLQTDDGRLKRLGVSPLTALLLTQSMGSMLLFALMAGSCLIAQGLRAANRRDGLWDSFRIHVSSYLLQGILAIIAFVGFRSGVEFADGVGAVLFTALSYGFYRLWPKAEGALTGKDGKRHITTLLAGLLIVGLIGVALMLLHLIGSRIAQATGTLAERWDQAIDAAGLLAANPTFGIGPDQWQHVYASIKTADYESTLIHCGYLQVGMDAGILAMLLVIAALAFGIAMSLRQRQRCIWPLLMLLALHSLLDFDLMFGFYPVLIGILCAIGTANRE